MRIPRRQFDGQSLNWKEGRKMKGKEPIKPHITHVMADGRVLDSIEGYVIPCSGHTAVVYRILADCVKRQLNSEKK
jgi:hypothetical protein